jgi:hypothetical protein
MRTIEELIRGVESKFVCVFTHPAEKDPYGTGYISYINRENAGRSNRFSVALPADVQTWWNFVFRATLFKDIEYGQWGLRILSEEESYNQTLVCLEERRDEFEHTDVILGTFIGDSDVLFINCEAGPDFGNVYVARPIDERKDWPKVANSFSEFLGQYIDSFGNKFWETSESIKP